MAAVEEGFNNAAVTEIEEKSDEEFARKQFIFARINMKVHSLLNHYI